MNTRLLLISISTLCLILLSNFINHENKQLYGTSLDIVSIQKTLLAQNSTQLEYNFLGQKIPLTLKKDTTAVLFKPQKIDRSSGAEPYSVQLQEALADTTRSSTNGTSERKSEVEITPLGQNYALVRLAAEAQDISVIEADIQKEEYVEEVLPVLTISNSNSEKTRDIILPNEIIVSFDHKLSETELNAFLKEQSLELIRPVRFSPNLYIVKSLKVSGVKVLEVANELNSVPSIQSAAPNFIETLMEETASPSLLAEGSKQDNLTMNSPSNSLLPNQPVIQRIEQILRANPNLVIVAAAGNDNTNKLDYPAAISEVIAVGATNLEGFRASYSDYGSDAHYRSKLTVVAPGGDFAPNGSLGGVLTTGGTSQPLLMSGINITGHWGRNLDVQGKYRWVTGTSFATPVVSGVIALIKGEDTKNQLNRQDILHILQKTASYEQLKLRDTETRLFNRFKPANFSSPEEYFFGAGLVNAEAAVTEAKARLQK